jgi:hypothetical protein
MSGAEIASEVAAAIAEAGAEVGDGTPLTGVILRLKDQTTPASYPPPTPDDDGEEDDYDRFACTLILSEYSARDRDGTNITHRDLKAMIAPDAETIPRNGDSLAVQGRTYSIENVMPYQPGGTVLYYMAQVRAGE